MDAVFGGLDWLDSDTPVFAVNDMCLHSSLNDSIYEIFFLERKGDRRV